MLSISHACGGVHGKVYKFSSDYVVGAHHVYLHWHQSIKYVSCLDDLFTPHCFQIGLKDVYCLIHTCEVNI